MLLPREGEKVSKKQQSKKENRETVKGGTKGTWGNTIKEEEEEVEENYKDGNRKEEWIREKERGEKQMKGVERREDWREKIKKDV